MKKAILGAILIAMCFVLGTISVWTVGADDVKSGTETITNANYFNETLDNLYVNKHVVWNWTSESCKGFKRRTSKCEAY